MFAATIRPETLIPVSLVIVGEEDRSLPVPFSQRIHERLPGSSLEIIPGAGRLSISSSQMARDGLDYSLE
ncbi:alpha/beta fold hydrolase [Halomonas sp. THAF12]|uniref:alpha/beta fold hydrolase n=1 Tax=Halomonas sp. B23F22_10 TaxID=3459515 RepID=UPI00373E8AC3